MNPFNPNNPNPNNPNPNNPNPNQPNLFSTPAYTPTMDPSWVSLQFTFSGFQQSPNAFKQMSQVQQMQQYQALQQMDELITEFRSFKELAAEKYSHKKTVSADYARAEDFRIMRLDLNSVPEDERELLSEDERGG
ncbi:hypothetical protein HanXRQr2_Chr03g0094391 [Helianthus annuus]|uniref:Uncharacterized protein n=1 Tax=Helianthus annuus TaxID=4232 RepID=A0A9K3JDG3_HELAN|nr:hypothetical protein HanXRQr2_Chr03g0094391 [Helianthus annuus]